MIDNLVSSRRLGCQGCIQNRRIYFVARFEKLSVICNYVTKCFLVQNSTGFLLKKCQGIYWKYLFSCGQQLYNSLCPQVGPSVGPTKNVKNSTPKNAQIDKVNSSHGFIRGSSPLKDLAPGSPWRRNSGALLKSTFCTIFFVLHHTRLDTDR